MCPGRAGLFLGKVNLCPGVRNTITMSSGMKNVTSAVWRRREVSIWNLNCPGQHCEDVFPLSWVAELIYSQIITDAHAYEWGHSEKASQEITWALCHIAHAKPLRESAFWTTSTAQECLGQKNTTAVFQPKELRLNSWRFFFFKNFSWMSVRNQLFPFSKEKRTSQIWLTPILNATV